MGLFAGGALRKRNHRSLIRLALVIRVFSLFKYPINLICNEQYS